jgi:hypothetical protein
MNSLRLNQLIDVIKSKLKEFVDEFSIDNQLVDYIMSMIHNQNTQDQITEDLTPFMGEDRAPIFSAWLEENLKLYRDAATFNVVSSSSLSEASSEELDIQIDENEFRDDDFNPSIEDNIHLNSKKRSIADVKLEKLRSKRRMNEHSDRHRHSKKNQPDSDIRFSNRDNKIVKSRANQSKRKVYKIAAESENFSNKNKNRSTSFSGEKVDQEMKDDSIVESEIIAKNRLIKCSEWPLCDKGDECAFLHPNKPCILFPNCQYGKNCRYIHPVCRYDGFCARAECPFMHLVADNKEPTVSLNETLNADELASETNDNDAVKTNHETASNKKNSTSSFYNKPIMQVKFLYSSMPSNHYNFVSNRFNTIPINCKFDSLCKNPNCMYLHTNILPQKSQLKWTKADTLIVNSDVSNTESTQVAIST